MKGTTRSTRNDRGRLGKLTRTSAGAYVIPATVGESGVLNYPQPDGTTRREWRPPEELFRADTLASLADIPVTYDHPSNEDEVNPRNFRQFVIGHVRGPGRQDGKGILSELVVGDADAISDIEDGNLLEVSTGYSLIEDWTPGVTPDGQAYDLIQRNIIHNHVSLQPPGGGRAGSSVRLRLDSRRKEIDMKKVIVNGVEYTEGSTEHIAALHAETRRQVEAATADAARRVDAANAERDRATARADADRAGREAAEKAAKAAADEVALQKRVDARAKLLESARTILGADYKTEFRTDAGETRVKTDHAIRLDALIKANPGQSYDGKSEAYVEAAFDHVVAGSDDTRLAKSRQDAGERQTSSGVSSLPGVTSSFDEEGPSDLARLLHSAG